ncbi:LysR substrate-binding domain-containing protein [Rhodanobacter sp. DHG33]|uniref:LysR substrate-binding domain-containing protein n=1 Tax=Rhodanobacter sp. DHG33 TaxID=2775921 RepID=UPI00177CB29E|nr:LysR substrate-binding domain-containing protein [Rhodanobacter sp. DHG33]MBD8899532.1 LysR family transcriptional regulator [Rhodanobacter sp. DHG33]
MPRVNFDIDTLRSFATGIELGSFAQAAERLNRSTSAVSAQLKKLELQAGTPLLRKAGRGMALTEAGETMLGYARRLLELNDEAVAAIRGVELAGRVRLGMQEDFGERLLPAVLGRFARTHPRLRIEARIARNAELLDGVNKGKLDLALAWEAGAASPHAERVGRWPMRWVVAADASTPKLHQRGESLPLVVLESPCLLRSAAIAALDRAGIAWRIAFSSTSLAGTWAAVNAGLGVSVRTSLGLPDNVRALSAKQAGLPALPMLGLALYRAEAEPSPAVAQLAGIIQRTLAAG